MARKPDLELKDTTEAIRARSKKVELELKSLARQIDELNHAYLMYFRGVESREPYKRRQLLERKLRAFQMPTMTTTMLRFRHTQLIQRMIAFRGYWDRTSRSIEEGTFKFGHGTIPPSSASSSWGTAEPTRKTKPDSVQTAPDDSPEKAPPSERKFEQLYNQYVTACSGADVRTKAPSYAAFEKSLDKQQKATEARIGADSIRYEVRMKNGEPKLIAVIKKKA